MNLLPSSLVLTNLFTIVCRLLSCDSEIENSSVNERKSSTRRVDTYENVDKRYSNTIVNPQENLEVSTKAGRIQGFHMTNVRGDPIYAFEGIKYAEAPSESRRFKPPVPKKPWNGTLMANNPGSVCMQLHYGQLRGSEDCLSLNVYTKNINPPKPYPVLIFIHGGFWLSGGGQNLGPSYLSVNDVILVTFNYRLGVLGFFSSGHQEIPGNNGLRDQAAVIEWVYNNIGSFGGDNTKITLSGHSAGSVSTHLQMISNNHDIKNKIKSAISMSGTGYNVWGLNKLSTAKLVSEEMANVSGCPFYHDSRQLVGCMRNVDADVLVANQLFTFKTGFFLPSIEPEVPGAFLTNTPDQVYLTGNVAKIPWIATMTSKELNLPIPALQANVVVSFLRAAINTDLSSLLSFRRKGVNEDMVRSKIVEYYGRSDSVNTLSQREFSQIATDRYFTVAIRKAVQMHSQIAPTYSSIFNYSSNLGRAGRRGLNPAEYGTLHGDDLVYFLNSSRSHPPIGRYDSHFAISKLLANLFGNFAAYGEPLYETEDNEIYKIWDKIDNPDKLRFLWIDEAVKMVDDPFTRVSKFWENLGITDTTSSFRI